MKDDEFLPLNSVPKQINLIHKFESLRLGKGVWSLYQVRSLQGEEGWSMSNALSLTIIGLVLVFTAA